MPMNPSIETPAKLRLPAIAPGDHHCHHAKAGKDKHAGLGAEAADAFAASKSRYGYRGIKAALRTGVPEKVTGRIMAEDGPVAHVPRRRGHGSHEGGTNPAPGTPITRDFTAERPNEKRLTDITEIKARDGKGVPLAAGRLLRWQDRRIHRRLQPQRGAGQPDAGESGLDAAGERASPRCIPTVDATAGGPDWLGRHGTLRADALHEREGRVRRTTRPRRDSSAG